METFFSEKFYFVGRRLIIIIPGKSGSVTSFLKLILHDHGGDHEDVANAAADGHRRQQEEPRHPGPRGGQRDRGNIEVAVHAPRLIHPYL